ncbi:MAG: cell wall hydrolase [Clostridium sp.]|uniref:cell wall hydrolase n=1 Tax=Clostridium sp. TaxID=1506 RepID=UPI00290AAD81|nr:cell wall hydrolase [Clostridium sp.]MDU4938289.1 cell wall hydrolase [Clostridium sp.]
MKKFICQFTLCLALLSLFCSAIPAKAIVTGNTSSYDITLEEINKVNKLNNINTEETVEVFSHGQEKIYITQDDIDLMAKLVYAESRGEPFEGKVAVASVVLNRLLNPGFPNSIKGVIFQTNAFSCVRDRDIKANPDQSCYDAVYEAINGKDPTNEALYFYNPAIATCSWMKQTQKKDTKSIGNHVFFKC